MRKRTDIVDYHGRAAVEHYLRLAVDPAVAGKPSCSDDLALCELTDVLARDLGEDPDLKPYIEKCARIGAAVRRRRRSAIRIRYTIGVAAALALAVLTLFPFLHLYDKTYDTTVGEQRTIILPDNSSVTLNTDTRIVIRYSDRVRRIELTRGEALFSVVRDRLRPFEVLAGSGVIRAVGTSFNVTSNGEMIQVAVLKGVVEVQPQAQADAHSLEDGPGDASVLVEGGQAVRFLSTGTIVRWSEANVRRINAWRAGRLEFDRMRLGDAIAEHNRYTNRKILIGDERLNDLLVSGIVQLGDTESLIFLLENSLDLTAVRHADTIILLSTPKSEAATAGSPGARRLRRSDAAR